LSTGIQFRDSGVCNLYGVCFVSNIGFILKYKQKMNKKLRRWRILPPPREAVRIMQL
jgi:hypothetical protein